MSKLEDSLSLMARLDAMDKKCQEHRARIQKEFQSSKLSRDYIKDKAIKLLNNCIIQCDCDYYRFFYMMNGATWLFFTEEEWLEIGATVIRILQSEAEFDKYCREQGLN